MSSYLLQEDGLSKIALEDGTGFIILEQTGTTLPRPIAPIMAARRRNRRRMWWLPFLLTLFQ